MLVALLDARSNLVKTEISQPDGSFIFEKLLSGDYTLSIDDPAFEPLTQSVSITDVQPQQTIALQLKPLNAQKLQEVTVTQRKPMAEYKIDRTVVNVEAMMSSAGADAMDVLEKSPGILVDQDGTITFKGKSGVTVFIDDKPTYLSGAELEAYLKSLPASTLEQIELISNPPAKYEAAGSAGIINIKTRKDKSRGFNGNFNARASIGKRKSGRTGLSLNYKESGFRLFGNVGLAQQESLNDLRIFRHYFNEDGSTKSLFDQRTLMNRKSEATNLRVGADVYLSEKTTLGVNASGMLRKSHNKNDGNSRLYDAQLVLDSTIVADNSERTKFTNGGLNLNISHEFNKGRKWSADADYLRYDSDTDQRFSNAIQYPDGANGPSDASNGTLPSQIDIYAFKTDYVHPMAHEQNWETGYKISHSATDNVADYRDNIGTAQIPNYDMSNHFKYDETIQAAYLNYSVNFKKWSLQAGLRAEHTLSKGHQLGNPEKPASRFEKSYTNVFPTLYVLYKLDSVGNNQLAASYGKRINRPYFQDLNPFVSPLDKFTFYSGNPYLNPSFAHNVELSYRFKNYLNTTLSYNFTKDGIEETLEINNGIYYSRPGNLSKTDYVSLNVQSDVPLASWLATNVYAEVTHMRYDSPLYTEYLDTKGTFFYFSMNNRIKLGKGWSGEVGGYCISAVPSAQVGTRPKNALNVGVQKKILKDRGTLRFTMNDIFYSNLNYGTINNLRLTYANYQNRPDSRVGAITFTYAFGKAFEAKNADRSGAEAEQDRVKQ